MPRTPDYQRIAEDIKARVSAGTLSPGDQLPSIRELQRRYGVSAQPVKTALIVLRTEGLVLGRQGRGTFIDSSPTAAGPARRPRPPDGWAVTSYEVVPRCSVHLSPTPED